MSGSLVHFFFEFLFIVVAAAFCFLLNISHFLLSCSCQFGSIVLLKCDTVYNISKQGVESYAPLKTFDLLIAYIFWRKINMDYVDAHIL